MNKDKVNLPLVSIIIPTYGRTDYVEDAIRSVINQTYKNIEIIVCDDNASKIDVRSKIEKIVFKYPNCVLIQNAENLGGALNRNVGIKTSKGELISFLDDDDVYEPTRIETVVEMYNNHRTDNVGLIYTWCYDCDERLKIIGEYKTELSDNPLFQHMGSCLCATTQWTIPRGVLVEVGMFEQTPCKQDSILLLKILGAGYEILCVREVLSRFRNHNTGRISNSYQTHIIGEENYHRWCKKYYNKLSQCQIYEVERRFARILAYNHRGAGNLITSFRFWVLSLIYKIISKTKT